MATEKFANQAYSTLNGTIGAGDGTLVVTSAILFPTTPQFRVKIDNEILLVTGVLGKTFTVSRGEEGTTAASHTTGATIKHVLTAGALAVLKTDTFTAGGDLTGTATSQTIAALAVTDGKVAAANKDGVAGTACMRTLGTGATQACAGNDARLSDARTPTSHGTTHKHIGGDEVATATAAANAIPKAGGAGTLAIGWLPTSGTPAAVAPTASTGSDTNVPLRDHVHAAMPQPGTGPYGFENRTDSEISFTDGTREFKIQPKSPATSWSMWAGLNTKITKSAAETLVIANSVGEHYIYYNGTSLAESGSFPGFNSIFVAMVYWTGTKRLGLADERHMVVMDWTTHGYLHNTVGTRYQSGLTLVRLATGTGGANGDAQVSLDGGTIWDEDIKIDIIRSASPSAPFEQELGLSTTTPGQLPIYYRTGATGPWTKDTATTYPVRPFDGTPGSRIGYNLNTAGTWSIADPGSNNYVAVWIVATTSQDEPVIAIMGQRLDTSLANAQANNLWESLSFGALPFPEIKSLYRLIYRTNTAYANTIKAYVAHTQDLRSVSNLPAGTYVASDHGSLSGRTAANSHPAVAVSTDTTNFTGILTATETDTQLALDKVAAWIKMGTGDPESVVTAGVGAIFLRTDGGTSTTLYVKESGAGNTGWVAK